jgi:hypothetical protein
MTCCGSENDFCKKLGAHLIRAKGQTHPGSNEIDMSLCKIQNITLKVCALKRELICVSQMIYYLCGGVVPSFSFAVLVAASQKSPILAL